jgi:hypothetical protein
MTHDAPLLGNGSVGGSVGGVALRHSAYTWWAMHRPVSTAARVLTRGAQRLSAPAGASSATRPASSRATGMRNGEQET